MLARYRFQLILGFVLSIAACRPVNESPRPYEVYPQDLSYFAHLINPVDAKDNATVSVHEDQYPIRLKLFADGRFQYTLRKLGDGWGRWTFNESGGYLDLYAERTLFVMQMQIRSRDPNNRSRIVLEFSDRFGPKYLDLSHE